MLHHPQCCEVYDTTAVALSPCLTDPTTSPEGHIHNLNHGGVGGLAAAGSRRLLHRGPRVRAGLHVGEVTCDVHVSTGRLSYRGRVMNRASRIAYKAHDGQVSHVVGTPGPCARPVWEHVLTFDVMGKAARCSGYLPYFNPDP